MPSLLAAAGFRVSGHLVPGTTQRLFGGTGLLHVQERAWTRKGSFAWEGAAVAGGLRSLYTKQKKKVQESSFKGVVRQEADFGKDVMKVFRKQHMVPAR